MSNWFKIVFSFTILIKSLYNLRVFYQRTTTIQYMQMRSIRSLYIHLRPVSTLCHTDCPQMWKKRVYFRADVTLCSKKDIRIFDFYKSFKTIHCIAIFHINHDQQVTKYVNEDSWIFTVLFIELFRSNVFTNQWIHQSRRIYAHC